MEKYYTLQLCGYDYCRFIIGCSGETERYITENHRLLNFTDKTELLKYAENNNIDISYEESIDFYTPDIYDFSQILKIVRISINISKTFDIPYIGNEERFSELYKTMESFTKNNIKQEDIIFKWKPAEFKMITELIRDSMHIIHASFTPIPVNYYLVAVSDSGYYSYTCRA